MPQRFGEETFTVPQCDKDHRWVERSWDGERHILPPEPSKPLAAAAELLESLLSRHPIDPRRGIPHRSVDGRLRRLGPGVPRYREYPDTRHDSWTKAFAEPNLLPWLFSRSAGSLS